MQAAEAAVRERLVWPERFPAALREAVEYAVLGGGKRLRPVVCLAAAEAVGGRLSDAAPAAAAIELLHSYTLVHDDLPAMDGDEFRRGRPSVWKRFGEATAVLCGDALQAMAFAAAAASPRAAGRIVAELAARACGVVAGQAAESDAALASDPSYVYLHKTGDLFAAAAAMGALAAGAGETAVAACAEFGEALGMAFQYQDDRIDGDGLCRGAELETRIADCTRKACAALERTGGRTGALAGLARLLAERRN